MLASALSVLDGPTEELPTAYPNVPATWIASAAQLAGRATAAADVARPWRAQPAIGRSEPPWQVPERRGRLLAGFDERVRT